MEPETFYVLREQIMNRLRSPGYITLVASAIVLSWLISIVGSKTPPRVVGAPVHGYRSRWEPSLLLQLRFVTSGHKIIASGYKKFKDRPFVVRRYDSDISVLPLKYLEELQSTSREKLNSKIALSQAISPKWTYLDFMLEPTHDIMIRSVKSMLSPNLGRVAELVRAELDYAWNIDFPQPEDWMEVDIQKIVTKLIARMSAKAFLGQHACRDPKWLDVTIGFTHHVFITSFTMRMFPTWLRPIIAPFLPVRWQVLRDLKLAEKFVGQLSQKHSDALANGDQPEETLLNWMIENGDEETNKLPLLAGRQCILTLAGIHTTSNALSQAIFDLCTYPEWIPVLREEVEGLITTDGRPGDAQSLDTRQWLSKLHKLDSFVAESQRLSTIILLRPQRIALAPLTLKDGTHIPRGTHIAWPGQAHVNDPATVSDPDKFDPMRNYRKRHENNGENINKFIAGQTSLNSLAFGYGSQACPGRYFALIEMKLLLIRLLLEYDIAFPKGKSSPRKYFADENVFTDPRAKIIIRKRVV